MTASDTIDPILVSVLQRRLKSITEEMGLTLLRTTRSPILNEARDFVTGLYDARGRMLEQTEYIPVLAFALQPVCEHIIDYFGDDISDGDALATGNRLDGPAIVETETTTIFVPEGFDLVVDTAGAAVLTARDGKPAP